MADSRLEAVFDSSTGEDRASFAQSPLLRASSKSDSESSNESDVSDESTSLSELYRQVLLEVRHAVREIEREVQDATSEANKAVAREASLFFKNARSLLVCWGCDIRVESESLEAIRGSMLSLAVRSIFENMISHLQSCAQAGTFHESNSQSELLNDMSHLRDFASPIRVLQAVNSGRGPYDDLQEKINVLSRQYRQMLKEREEVLAQAVIKSGSRVVLKRNPNFKPYGPGSYVWLMKKYNIKPTLPGPFQIVNNKLVKWFADGTTGDVQASDVQNDSSYTAPVTVGTPGQTMNLDFDSGSSDLWFWSTALPQSTLSGTSHHTVFDPSKSSTFQTSRGSTWKITYGDGSGASGTVGTDNVTIGCLTIKAQACELVNQISQQFTTVSSDGVCGLAWSTISTISPTPVATPVENMISQQDIQASQELFTAYLSSWRDTQELDKGESWYTFGHIDQDALGGKTPEYVNIDNSQGYWMFTTPGGTVNGTFFTIGKAIADTGANLTLLPDAACKAIYDAIPGSTYDSQQQGYLYPTSTTVEQLPVVQVNFGAIKITIKKEDLGYTEATAGMYYGGIQSLGNQSFSILGNTFLKNIYCIFDVGGKRLGAVQRSDTTRNVTLLPASW